MGDLDSYLGIDMTSLFILFQINGNDGSFSILNRLRSNSYYFGRIIRNSIFTIQTR